MPRLSDGSTGTTYAPFSFSSSSSNTFALTIIVVIAIVVTNPRRTSHRYSQKKRPTETTLADYDDSSDEDFEVSPPLLHAKATLRLAQGQMDA
jgi:hypothetical protein